jgi:flagellar protein FliJ
VTRSDRLKPAARVAESRERAAAQDVGLSVQHLAELEARLAELLRYREEYAQRLTDAGGSLDAAQLADFRAFLTRLNEAISYQEARVKESRRLHDRLVGRWSTTRQKVDALGKVMTRCLTEERREEDRQEQKEQDDRAQRRKPRPDEGVG